MLLEELGYNKTLEEYRKTNNLEGFEVGRVVIEHKERYIVKTENGEYEAEIVGHIRFTAVSREDYPAVGDWVALSVFDSNFGVIHKIYPRSSVIKRQAVGQISDIQIIATNIDYAFLVQAVDRDFNINRLERYLTICYASKVEPIIILTKCDLIDEQEIYRITENVNARIENIPVIAISNQTLFGYESIKSIIKKGKTYCMLGSSGVGKSTLLNNLSGKQVMKTGSISLSTSKGKHVTSHRELIILDSGGILIDNPGMREVGIADSASGLETTFDRIYELSKHCKYVDCTHMHEVGCAVTEAVEQGELDEGTYQNYIKLEKEKKHFETTLADKRRHEKIFGKIIKKYKQDMGKYED